MPAPALQPPRRVLILSSHPLFSEGLRRMLHVRPQADVQVIGVVQRVAEALAAINALHPDLVVVDYDDETVDREEFLARFVAGDRQLRVVLLSLEEGGSEAVVYDRRNLAAARVEDWLATV